MTIQSTENPSLGKKKKEKRKTTVEEISQRVNEDLIKSKCVLHHTSSLLQSQSRLGGGGTELIDSLPELIP